MDVDQVRDCIAKAIPSLKSIGALAIRLGDLRPKADNAVQHVNWLAWNMPRVIDILVRKIHTILDGAHRDKALQRLGSMRHEQQNHKAMQLDISFSEGLQRDRGFQESCAVSTSFSTVCTANLIGEPAIQIATQLQEYPLQFEGLAGFHASR